MLYYDKAGKPLTLREWAVLFEDMEYRRIGYDEFANGAHVSTVWLGLDHNWFPGGPPLIFKSMVFDGVHDQEMIRYSTEVQAIQGHDQLCARVRDAEALLATPFDELPVLGESVVHSRGDEEE